MKVSGTAVRTCIVLLSIVVWAGASSAQNRITILTDAFGKSAELSPDWGYSALVEFEGKRILFDTGDDAALFQSNVIRMHVDLSHLDYVVISHAHGDHTAGLRYVLSLNPGYRCLCQMILTSRGLRCRGRF